MALTKVPNELLIDPHTVTQTGTGAITRTVDSKLKEFVSVKDFGAVGDGTTDDTAAIQAAIDAASGRTGRCVVELGGSAYRTTDEIFIKKDSVLSNGTILFDPAVNDKFAINIGKQDGTLFVRVGGVSNVVVDASSSIKTGLVGFNIAHWARACFINNCRAVMNVGSPPTDRGAIGFSFYGIRADLAGSAGAYQNVVSGCSAYACKTAYRLDTAGYGETGFKPEMNGNIIRDCAAYACRTHAVLLGEGAQDNIINVRADTFQSDIGNGTTLSVVKVRGSYNYVNISEEVGSRADTQYTVRFEGTNPRYNHVDYMTQQVVTEAIFDNTSGIGVGKNTARFAQRDSQPDGGQIFTVSGYESVVAGTNTLYNSVMLPGPCKLVKVVARASYSPTSYTRFYFAKNGSVDTLQRLTWSSSDSANTIKTKLVDQYASTAIDSRFIYDEGDFVDVTIDQDASAGQLIRYTLFFMMLNHT
jgi:hypothetical protein